MNRQPPLPFSGDADWWIQRVTLAAILALALVLVSLGVALYAPSAAARTSSSPPPDTEGTHP